MTTKSRFNKVSTSGSAASVFESTKDNARTFKEILGTSKVRGPEFEAEVIDRIKLALEKLDGNTIATIIVGAKKLSFQDVKGQFDKNAEKIKNYFATIKANSIKQSETELAPYKAMERLKNALELLITEYTKLGGTTSELNWERLYKSVEITDLIDSVCEKLMKKERVVSYFVYSKLFWMGITVDDGIKLLWMSLAPIYKIAYLARSKNQKKIGATAADWVKATKELAAQSQMKSNKEFKVLSDIQSIAEFKTWVVSTKASAIKDIVAKELDQLASPFALGPMLLKQCSEVRGRTADPKKQALVVDAIQEHASMAQYLVDNTEAEFDKGELDVTNKGIKKMFENFKLLGLAARVFTKETSSRSQLNGKSNTGFISNGGKFATKL